MAVAAIAAATFRGGANEPKESVVHVETPGPTVVKDLRELARLETATLIVEKIVDVRDHQTRLRGLVEADDALLFVARGEVVLGVDFAKLPDDAARFDESTKTAYVTLPRPEVLSTRFDEVRSYVHARSTDLLAKRNEALEATARREAQAAFTAAGNEPSAIERAKAPAEKHVRTLAKAWGAKQVIVTWKDPEGERGPL